jgi:hypothetical protein
MGCMTRELEVDCQWRQSLLLSLCPGWLWSPVSLLFTELSPSWGAANFAAPQELPSILWNPKVQYRVYKSPPLVPVLSHIHPIHCIPSYLSKPLTCWISSCSYPRVKAGMVVTLSTHLHLVLKVKKLWSYDSSRTSRLVVAYGISRVLFSTVILFLKNLTMLWWCFCCWIYE